MKITHEILNPDNVDLKNIHSLYYTEVDNAYHNNKGEFVIVIKVIPIKEKKK